MGKIISFFVLTIAIALTAFTVVRPGQGEDPIPIPKSKQRSGNAAKGYTYLITGDYLRSGIPIDFFPKALRDKRDQLQRTGLNADIPFAYTAVKAPNGVTVVAPNCLQCHAQVFDSVLYVGMGNAQSDFTLNPRTGGMMFAALEQMLSKSDPRNLAAALPFIRASKALAPQIHVPVRGVNVADRIAAVLAAHRNPQSFAWSDTAQIPVPAGVVPTDVPAWWLLKKKNAMFYNGFGRGDFGRFLMASNLLTVNDTAESREVDSHFNDVLAYILSIQAPKYPRMVDPQLVAKGEKLFGKNCARCHGEYGKKNTYPNLLIPASVIQTDSLLYSSNYSTPQFINWFNKSWFTTGDHPAQLVPFRGYIAPPLDGVWVTAPYLHNGSVPTLEALLNSAARPAYWSRNFSKPVYDYVQVGWQYETRPGAGDNTVYNTTLPGYSNSGHYFGDVLSDTERKAVIEYLKTL
jgi:cytochrome c2